MILLLSAADYEERGLRLCFPCTGLVLLLRTRNYFFSSVLFFFFDRSTSILMLILIVTLIRSITNVQMSVHC
jgi:hypothetical protein